MNAKRKGGEAYMLAMLLIGFLLGALTMGLVWNRRVRTGQADSAQAELAASQLRLRDYAIGQMLKGAVPDFEHISDYYRVFHLEFPAEAFMLLVVKLRGYPRAGGPDAQENAYGTVKEELMGILGLSRTLYFAEKDGVLVCFYCQPGVTIQPPSDNQETLRELLFQQCRACAAALLEKHGIDVLIALGKFDLGGFALHTNYLSTKALLEQAVSSRWGDSVIKDTGSLTQRTDQELSRVQRQFYNCFVCFQYRDAAEYLFHMVELRISNYFDPFPEAREVVAEQLRFCTNMLELPLNIMLPLPEGGTICMRELMASPNTETLHTNLLRYFSGLETYTAKQGDQAAPTVQRVRDYIDRHYREPEISVSSLAEQFRLNTSYLSRQFKQEYGCGVLEYIHKCRVAEAKTLIAQDAELDTVAIQTGYPSRRALDSAFSRYEGITPRAYQRQLSAAAKEKLK